MLRSNRAWSVSAVAGYFWSASRPTYRLLECLEVCVCGLLLLSASSTHHRHGLKNRRKGGLAIIGCGHRGGLRGSGASSRFVVYGIRCMICAYNVGYIDATICLYGLSLWRYSRRVVRASCVVGCVYKVRGVTTAAISEVPVSMSRAKFILAAA